ncbi:hypothetical protein H5410_058282 [Solanum commersonii]|uniref:DUF1985 domain-containing protein n=1 Tax=Solanum commersonii TaxID=4109 RepID=A0A9J5WSN5_SOLCO|nr:hypothetical protein H5410_058282 [Solanum commersonii]
MEQSPSYSVGVSHTKNKSKRLHNPLAMNDEIIVKQKKRLEKPPQKREESMLEQYRFVIGYELCYQKNPNISIEIWSNVQHDNKDVLHIRHANKTVLQFGIKEFAIVTCLKCKGNVTDFSYPESTPSWLLQRYFPDSTAGITKSRLIQRFVIGNWDTTQDVVQTTILYFINTFMLCHLGETSIKIEEFLMVEDGTYELYPWGKIAFDKLITSLSINQEIVVKVANGIPRICNWSVVAVKPKYEKFMSRIFS